MHGNYSKITGSSLCRVVVQQEYNGGLLHKEEIMLRKAMYASLVESKKPSPKKPMQHPLTTGNESGNGLCDTVNVNLVEEEEENSMHCSNLDEFDNNNSPSQSEESKDAQDVKAHAPSFSEPTTHKKTKISKEPSKLLNYVIKKKKEKKSKARTLLRTPSPSKLQAHSDGGIIDFSNGEGRVNFRGNTPSLPHNGKVKKKKRQRGALAVFVAMNKSAGGKLNKNRSLGKELLNMKAKKKRRRKRKNLETQVRGAEGTVGLGGNRQTGVESGELPTKKYKKEEKKK